MTPQRAIEIFKWHTYCTDNCGCRVSGVQQALVTLIEVVREYERLSLIEQLQASIAEERAKRERGAPA